MEKAILSVLSEASVPLDKQELVPFVSTKMSRSVSAKEVNKALYALAGRGEVAQGAEKHGEKPTWVPCGKASAPAPAPVPVPAPVPAPASSDDEENRPLQPKAKRAKPKHEPTGQEDAASGSSNAAKCPTGAAPVDEPGTVKQEPVDVAATEEGAAAADSTAAAVKAEEEDEDEEELPLSSRVRPVAKGGGSGGRPAQGKGGRRKGAAAHEAAAAAEDDDEEEEEEDDVGLAVAVAQAVLAAGAAGDHERVLSACGVPVTRDAPVATLRKAYRSLAKLIHPDKLGGRHSAPRQAVPAHHPDTRLGMRPLACGGPASRRAHGAPLAPEA